MNDAHLRLVESGLRLYERSVMFPEAVDEEELVEWAADFATDGPPRDVVRSMRRIMRRAQKLAAYWLAEVEHSSQWGDLRRSQLDDWRARVDEASGIPAWRELLDVAETGYAMGAAAMSEHLGWLFPQVHHAEWPGGQAESPDGQR